MSDLSVRLNADELAALAGLPSLAVVAYVLAIRPWMDYRTGVSGMIRGISWQSIREAVEVEGHQGMPRQSFSREQVRRAVAHLEKAGLLTSRSTDAALVFSCRLATRDSCVQKKADSMLNIKPATPQPPETRAAAGLLPLPKPKADTKADTKANTPPAYPLTTITTSPNTETVGGGAGEFVVFHRTIKPEYHDLLRAALDTIPEAMRQTAIDELAGAIVARAGTSNPIRSAPAYFRAILADIRGGGFMPTHAADIARARLNDAERTRREAASRETITNQAQAAQRFRPGMSAAEFLRRHNAKQH